MEIDTLNRIARQRVTEIKDLRAVVNGTFDYEAIKAMRDENELLKARVALLENEVKSLSRPIEVHEASPPDLPFKQYVANMSRNYVLRAVNQLGLREAAKRLKISVATIYRKVPKLKHSMKA